MNEKNQGGEIAQKLIERLESWPIQFVSGVCMCGSEMDGHPIDNHAPTDSGEYNVHEAIKEAKSALALPPREQPEPVAEPDEDEPWPESPLANAIYQHVQSQFCLDRDEASDEAGAILKILSDHGLYAHRSKQPELDATISPLAGDEPEKALEDAVAYGVGFIVDGKRVEPNRVTICHGTMSEQTGGGGGAVATEVAERVVLAVCELPDRTSPEDWPEAMLVTGEELHHLVYDAILAALSTNGVV